MARRGRMGSADDNVLRSLGKRLREERERRQISLSKMAELTSYAKSHLSNIETGQSNANSDIIAKYEEVLGLERGALSSGQNVESPTSRTRSSGDMLTHSVINPKDSVSVRDSLPTVVLANLIAQSTSRIWILEIWIGDDLRYLKDSFLDADARGVEIKITLLNEESPFADQRTRDLMIDSMTPLADTRQMISENKRLLKSWSKDAKNMEVREHHTLPSFQLIIIDNLALVGLYFHGITSRGGSQLEVDIFKDMNRGLYSPFGFYLLKEFEFVWNQSKDVDLA